MLIFKMTTLFSINGQKINPKSKVQGTLGQASYDRLKSKVEYGRKQTIFWAKVDDLWVRADDPGMQAEDLVSQSGRSSVNSLDRPLSTGPLDGLLVNSEQFRLSNLAHLSE